MWTAHGQGAKQCQYHEFSFGGYSPGGLSPVGSNGKAMVGGLGDGPPEAEAVCRHCLQILTAEKIKFLLENFAQLTS